MDNLIDENGNISRYALISLISLFFLFFLPGIYQWHTMRAHAQ